MVECKSCLTRSTVELSSSCGMFVFQGSVPNKFYVHNDIFRYEDEVFGESEAELDEGEGISKESTALDLHASSSVMKMNFGTQF